MIRKYKIEVFGRVQMVGFRWFTQRIATRLNINGNVRNTAKNTVQIIAEGEEEKLNLFILYNTFENIHKTTLNLLKKIGENVTSSDSSGGKQLSSERKIRTSLEILFRCFSSSLFTLGITFIGPIPSL